MDAQWHQNRRNELREQAKTLRLRRELRRERRNESGASFLFFMGIGMGMCLPVVAYVAYELAILYGFNL